MAHLLHFTLDAMRIRRLPLLALLAAAVLCLFVRPSGSQEAETAPTFADEVSVGYVLVPVIVRARSGGYAKNLEEEDFRLLVDGRRVDIESFETRAEAPASVVFLQDLSGSMGNTGKLEASREAIRFFLDRALPGDEFALASFSGGERRIEVPFTDELPTVREAVSSLEAYGTTALHDAVAWVPEISTAGRKPKRFVVLITDGVDNASSLSPQEARRLVREAQLPVYVLGLEAGNPFELTPEGKKVYRYADVLNLLAHETGGRYFSLSDPDDLKEALVAMAEDFRHQYVLGFATGQGRSRYRELRVEIEGGKSRSVLFRRGYKGPPPSDHVLGS